MSGAPRTCSPRGRAAPRRGLALFVLLAIALTPGSAGAGDPADGPSTERVIVFRDGGVLRMALPDVAFDWRYRTADGEFKARSIRLSETRLVQPGRTQPTVLLRSIESYLADLGDDSFSVRSRAQKALLVMPPAVAPLLREESQRTQDAEVRARLVLILKKLPPVPHGAQDDLSDRLQMPGDTTPLRGDLGYWKFAARFRGAKVSLDREMVQQIHREMPSAPTAMEHRTSRTARIPADTDEAFPPAQMTRVAFETDPAGKPLAPGVDVSNTFVPLGFTVNTSIPGAIVSVNTYDVGGRSRGQSCATHSPRFQGELTIRFCLPGNPAVPAGVTRVGFWVAAVSPDGTALEAYDSFDRRIAEVKTVAQNKDFLGLESSVPIAYLKVVPNPMIDGDYTIDDLVFDPPRPFVDRGHAKLYTVELAGGERLYAERLALAEGTLSLERLSIGLERIELAEAEAARLITPSDHWKGAKPTGDGWAKLTDGSVVQFTATDGLKLQRFAAGEIDAAQIAALWGQRSTYLEPKAEDLPKPGEAVLLAGGQARRFPAFRLSRDAIDLGMGAEMHRALFRETPIVWFAPVPAARCEPGRLRLVSGEEYVLGGGQFEFESWTAQGITIRRGGQRATIAEADVLSLTLAKRA